MYFSGANNYGLSLERWPTVVANADAKCTAYSNPASQGGLGPTLRLCQAAIFPILAPILTPLWTRSDPLGHKAGHTTAPIQIQAYPSTFKIHFIKLGSYRNTMQDKQGNHTVDSYREIIQKNRTSEGHTRRSCRAFEVVLRRAKGSPPRTKV